MRSVPMPEGSGKLFPLFTGPEDISMLKEQLDPGWQVENLGGGKDVRFTFPLPSRRPEKLVHDLTRLLFKTEHGRDVSAGTANQTVPASNQPITCFTINASWPVPGELVPAMNTISERVINEWLTRD